MFVIQIFSKAYELKWFFLQLASYPVFGRIPDIKRGRIIRPDTGSRIIRPDTGSRIIRPDTGSRIIRLGYPVPVHPSFSVWSEPVHASDVD
jgi:hypothetical protein